ncbi:MAG: nucleotidyl transferase AbiEii/AbiGii toxin family protein [Candidatus Micrarchaeia archaeon]
MQDGGFIGEIMDILTSVWLDEKQRMQLNILQDILIEIFKSNGNEIVFKGGTAISFFYNGDRFSEDLDFSVKSENAYLNIDNAIENLEKTTKHEIINDWESEIESSKKFRRYFLKFGFGASDIINIHIDCSIENVILEPEIRELANKYYAAKIKVMRSEEILAEKVRAIYTRQKGRDLYDLYFLAVLLKSKVSINLIYEKFKSYGVKEKYSFYSFEKKIEELRPYWNDLKNLINNFERFNFDEVKADVLNIFKNI